jgi:hypothetical protein
LFSYDIVVWPWIPTKQEGIILDLTKPSEQAKWELNWEDGCSPPLTAPKFLTTSLDLDVCHCSFYSNASRLIKIPKSIKYVKVDVCSKFAGGDGVVVKAFLDDVSYFYFINSNECKSIFIDISNFSDDRFHTIKFSVERNSICEDEFIIIKRLLLIKDIKISEGKID